MKRLTILTTMTLGALLTFNACKKDECSDHEKEKKECENKKSWTNETTTTIEEYSYSWNDSSNICEENVVVTHKDTTSYDTCSAMLQNGWITWSEYDECHCNEKNNQMNFWERAEDSTGYNYYRWDDSTRTCDLVRYQYDTSCEGQLKQGKITKVEFSQCDCESKEPVRSVWDNITYVPTWNPWTQTCEYLADSSTYTNDTTFCKVWGMVDNGEYTTCECISY